MKLTEFLQDERIQETIENASVICFQATAYPLLFCKQLIAHCSRSASREILPNSMHAENGALVMASLQTTFLGAVSWYWLGFDGELSKKSVDAWRDYLATYTGPNKLFFCTTQQLRSTKSRLVITIPETVNYALFITLARMGGEPAVSFADQIYQFHKEIPLETAMLLMQYGSLVGKNGNRFVEQWLHELIVPETSLFALSQAFFAKKTRTFFRQWKQVSVQYGAPFWIAFWAEQLWQAYAYVRLHKAGKGMDANRVGYRLPFSFKNRDWHSYSLDTLQQAHQELYALDFHLKNGGSEGMLDLFLVDFFRGTPNVLP